MRKFFVYFLTYIVMLMSGVGGVFLFTNHTSPARQVQQADSSAFDKVVSNIMNAKALTAGGEFVIKENGTQFANVTLSVRMDLVDGFTKFNLAGAINIERDGNNLAIDFAYIDSKIYVDLLGAKYQATMDDIGGLIKVVSASLSSVLPEVDIASMLDVNALMLLMQNVTEEKGENEILLKMNTSGGDIVIKTDLEYNIQSVDIPKLVFGEFTIDPNVALETKSALIGLEKPKDESLYAEASKQFVVLTALLNTVQTPFVAKVNILGQESDLIYDKTNASLSSKINGNELKITYYNNCVYANFGTFGIKCDSGDFDTLKEFFSDKIDFEQLTTHTIVATMIEKIKAIDFSRLTLEFLNQIVVDENGGLTFECNDFALNIQSYQSKITKAVVVYKGYTLESEFSYTNVPQVKVPSVKYLSATNVLDLANAMAQTAKSNDVNANIDLVVGEYLLNVNMCYAFNSGNIYLNLSTQIGENDFDITYQNGVAYVSYQGIKIKITEQTIKDLMTEFNLDGKFDNIESIINKMRNINLDTVTLNSIKQMFNINLTKEQKQAILAVAQTALNVLSSTTLGMNSDILSVISGDFDANIELNDGKISNLSIKYKEYSIESKFEYVSFEQKTIEIDEYIDAMQLARVAKNFISSAKDGIFATFVANYEDVSISGQINVISKDIEISAVATYGEYTANIAFVNDVVYVSALGAKVKFALSDIDKVQNLLNTLNVSMPQMPNVSIDANAILGVVNKLFLAYTSDKISANYEDYAVSLNIENNNISGAKLCENGAEILAIDFSTTRNEISVANPCEYLDITELFPLVEPIINTISSNNFSGTAVLKVSLNNQLVEFNIDYKISIVDGEIKANAIVTAYGITIDITYLDNVIYIKAGKLAVNAKISELDKIVEFVENNFGTISSQLSTISAVNITDILGMVTSALSVSDLSFVNTIDVLNNSAFIQIGKIGLTLEFDTAITGVEIEITDLDISEISIDSLNFATSINTSAVVIANSLCEYVDINDILSVANSVIATAKSNAVSGQIDLQLTDGVVPIDGITSKNLHFVINYNYSYNGGNIKFDANTELLGNTLSVVLVDNVVYIAYQDINVYATLESFGKIDLNAEISQQQIIEYVKLAISSISLSYDNDTLIVLGKNLAKLNSAKISITTENSELTNVSLTCDYASINITFALTENYNDVTLKENYIEAENIVELVKNIIDATTQRHVFAEIDLNIGEYSISGLVNYSENNLQAQISTQIFGKNLDVRLLENTIYANFDGMKVKFALSDINKVVELINRALGDTQSKMPNVDINIDKAVITKYLKALRLGYDGNKITTKVSNFDLKDFGLNVSSLDLSKIGIEYTKFASGELNIVVDCKNNTLNGVCVSVNDYANVNVKFENTPCNINQSTSGYFDIIAFLPFVEPFIDGYLSGMFGTMTISAPQIEKVASELVVDYAFNAGAIQLNTTILNQKIGATLKDNIIYLEISGLKYKFGINEIDDIIDLVCREFDITINKTMEDEFSLDNINFGDIGFELLNDKNLQITYKNLTLLLSIEKGFVASVEFDDVAVSLTQKVGAKAITLESADKYLPIFGAIEKASAIYSIISDGKVSFDLDFTYDTIKVTGNASIDYKTVMQTKNISDLKISATLVAFEKSVNIDLQNNVLYVNFDGIKVKFALSDIDTMLEWLESEFNVKIDTNANVDIDFKTLLKSICQSDQNIMNIETSLLSAILTFENNDIQSISVNYDKISAKIAITNNFEIRNIISENYSNVVDLLPVCSKILQVYYTKSIALDAEISAKLLGYDQIFDASISVDYSDKIKIDLVAEFKGLTATIYVRGSTIYVDFANLKIQFVESDLLQIVDFANRNFGANLIAPTESGIEGNMVVDFVNKNFNLGFELPYLGDINTKAKDINLDQIIDTIKKFDFSTFGTFTLNDNKFDMNISTGSISLDLAKILDVVVDFEEVRANASIIATSEAVKIVQINGKDYATVDELLNTIQCVIDTLNTQRYTVSASTQVYNGQTKRFDGSIKASLDISGEQKLFHGVATLNGEQDISVTLDFDGTYIYVNYSGLKLKIHKTNIKEIAGIVMAVFGYDINSLGIFGDVDLGNLNFDNFQNAMPNIDLGDPFAMLKLVQSIKYSNGALTINLDGKKISGNTNAQTMTLNISTANGELSHFDLNNMYTGVTSSEYFNLNIDFVDYAGVPAVSGTYFDISSISQLLKGVINTSELNDYHITATLDIKMTIIGIDIDWNIPIDIQIKLVNKRPVIKAVIGPMPSVEGVNNDVKFIVGDWVDGIYKSKDRYINIYYLDENVYIHRTENVAKTLNRTRLYEKKTMVHYTTFLDNIMYYVQYMTGFTDSIMSAINESMEKAKNRENPIDMGNVLLDYNNDNGNYNLKLNLKEISNDEKLDSIAISIKPSFVESAQKEYVTDLTMQMVMPLADGVNMNLESNDMKLIDIGETLDLSSVYNYANSYTYAEGAEWTASESDWECQKTVSYTMSFETNGGASVANITCAPSSTISLPTYANREVVSGNTKTTYRFDGWYTSETFDDGTKFDSNKMSRQDIKLYAKWTEIARVNMYTINFVTNGGASVSNINQYEGYAINLPTYDDRIEITDTEKTTYRFVGWYTTENFDESTKFELTSMPSESVTLYAKWEVVSNYQKQIINFIDGDQVIRTISGFYGDEITLSSLENKEISTETSYELYEFDGWFKSSAYEIETLFESNLMPNESFDLYAKWNLIVSNQTLTLFDGGSTISTIKANVGETISLPIYQTQVIDNITNHTRITRTFVGWFTTQNFADGTIFTATQMPISGMYLYAKWDEKVETIYSVKITNAGTIVYNEIVLSGTTIAMNTIDGYKDSTLVYSSANFAENTKVENFTISNDSAWYLRNKFTINVYSKYSSSLSATYSQTYELYEGSSVTLPSFSMLSTNWGSYTSEYTFGGYSFNNTAIKAGTVTTPNGNCTYIAIWTETQWCTVTFDVNAWTKPSWWSISKWCKSPTDISSVSNTSNNQIRIKRGSSLNTSNYVATCKCKYAVTYNFITEAWTTDSSAKNLNWAKGSNNSYDAKVITINSNCTLKPVWKEK